MSAETPDLPLMTLDTVGTETPADSAMYAMVTGRDVPSRSSSCSVGPSVAWSAKVAFPIIEPLAPGPRPGPESRLDSVVLVCPAILASRPVAPMASLTSSC